MAQGRKLNPAARFDPKLTQAERALRAFLECPREPPAALQALDSEMRGAAEGSYGRAHPGLRAFVSMVIPGNITSVASRSASRT
jgi:hypothetical protein